MKFTVTEGEWVRVLQTLFYVAAAAIVDYLAAHFNLLPASPWAMAIITPVVLTLKLFLDGKTTT